MPTKSRHKEFPQLAKKLKPALGFLLSVAFLNILMAIEFPAIDIDPQVLLKISPEILIILSFTCIATLLGIRFSRFFYLPLTTFVVFLRLFRIGETLIPMYFFRPFNLFLVTQFFKSIPIPPVTPTVVKKIGAIPFVPAITGAMLMNGT